MGGEGATLLQLTLAAEQDSRGRLQGTYRLGDCFSNLLLDSALNYPVFRGKLYSS
jgi:hypothetical protein